MFSLQAISKPAGGKVRLKETHSVVFSGILSDVIYCAVVLNILLGKTRYNNMLLFSYHTCFVVEQGPKRMASTIPLHCTRTRKVCRRGRKCE